MARLGVNGFGSFSRKKMTSSAGAKPGNAKNRLEIVLDKQVRDFIAINGKLRIYETKDGFPIKNVENDGKITRRFFSGLRRNRSTPSIFNAENSV